MHLPAPPPPTTPGSPPNHQVQVWGLQITHSDPEGLAHRVWKGMAPGANTFKKLSKCL